MNNQISQFFAAKELAAKEQTLLLDWWHETKFPIQWTDNAGEHYSGFIEDAAKEETKELHTLKVLARCKTTSVVYVITKVCRNPCENQIEWDNIHCAQDVIKS